MDVEEPFNPDYYLHVLSSLTVNSRALITELTSLADKYVDEADKIVSLIEERIKKCLPQYKLFAIYLVDSICKNIGNPYNLIFGNKLYNIFTQTYLVVTDTPTRQNLINLFKTWTKAQTSSGLELFPNAVIKKIEQFIIKATSINNQNGQGIPSNGMVPARITQDMLLREGNYLLQYIIAIDDEIDQINITLNKEEEEFIKNNKMTRNNLVFQINSISDGIMTSSREEFDMKAPQYQIDLQKIRKIIDDQSFQQQAFLKPLIPKIIKAKEHEGESSPESPIEEEDVNESSTSTSPEQIEINLNPKSDIFDDILIDINQDLAFKNILAGWGKPLEINRRPSLTLKVPETNNVSTHTPKEESEEPTSIASSLGLNFNPINFLDSFLGSPQNEITPIVKSDSLYDEEDDDDIDSYDPEHSIVGTATSSSSTSTSTTTTTTLQSSMKRSHPYDEPKMVKRVRFVE